MSTDPTIPTHGGHMLWGSAPEISGRALEFYRELNAMHGPLCRFRIDSLFSSTHHLARGEAKSAFITHGDSIFIDDSFAEREEVHRRHGIPVFAPDAVECLIVPDTGTGAVEIQG